MVSERKDLAKLGGAWAAEVLWYARAVRELQSRPTTRTSWTYLAAIHGIDPEGWVEQGIIPSLGVLPPQGEQETVFSQCQHAGWFFLPWHRGYLAAFEAILADWIAQQPGGMQDWALPYWNYLYAEDPTARRIPREFLDATLPDGSPNPLRAPRGGTQVLGPQAWLNRDITLTAQTTPMPYTAAPGTAGYGGAISGFAHEGDLTGAVELDPHNLVHVLIGGLGVGQPIGWMSDPNYAALDPIFWLHHCNIDRLWEAWMSDLNNQQENSSAWRNGPFPRQFRMPNPAGDLIVFIPRETLPGGLLAPAYDNLGDGTGIPPAALAAAQGVAMPASLSSGGRRSTTSSLVGANDRSLTITSAPTETRVALASDAVLPAAVLPVEERYYLNLEGVRGEAASGVLNIAIDVPGEGGSSGRAEVVETVALFGLAKASSTEGHQAGNGLSVAIDITDFTRRIRNEAPITPESLGVHISQPPGIETPITVDRVSVYKRPVE